MLPILVAGVLVDVDHLVDLGIHRLDVDGPPRYIVLPLHAWEWVFGLLLRGTGAATGLAGGLAVHLALDQLNGAIRHPLFYWITVRARHGFRAEEPLLHRQRFVHSATWMRRGPTSWL